MNNHLKEIKDYFVNFCKTQKDFSGKPIGDIVLLKDNIPAIFIKGYDKNRTYTYDSDGSFILITERQDVFLIEMSQGGLTNDYGFFFWKMCSFNFFEFLSHIYNSKEIYFSTHTMPQGYSGYNVLEITIKKPKKELIYE